jgi:hypothetical protein
MTSNSASDLRTTDSLHFHGSALQLTLMSSQTQETDNKVFTDTAEWLQVRLLEAKALRLTERLLVSVERSELQKASDLHDTSGIITARDRVAQAIQHNDKLLLEQAREDLLSEIQFWQLALKQLDSRIQAYNLRRFCDRAGSKLDLQIYAALVRFYRGLSHITQAQAKYDFAVTRLFSQNQNSVAPSLRFGRRQIIGHLIKMFKMWEGTETSPGYTIEQVNEGVARFDELIGLLTDVQQPEDLVASDLFNRIRACKSQIGEAFYSPEVSAAAVECNVLSSQVFARLSSIEGDELTESSSAIRALTGVLNDSPDSPSLTGLLKEIEEIQLQKDDGEKERLSRVVSLLRVVGGTTAPLPAVSSTQDSDEAVESEPVPEIEIPEIILQNPEYRELVERLRKASVRVHAYDLLIFLGEADCHNELQAESAEPVEFAEFSESNQLRHQALELILDADYLLTHELGSEGSVGDDLEPRLTDLIARMQKTGSRIRKITEQAVRLELRPIVDAHLYITNHLLECELELQSAIVRHSARELAKAETERLREAQAAEAAAAKAAKAAAREIKEKEKARLAKRLPARTRMIAAAAAAILLIALGLHFATPTKSPQAAVTSDITILTVQNFPSGELLKDARVNNEYLFGVVSEKWAELSQQQQREKAKEWVLFLKDRKINHIALISANGLPVASFSKADLFPQTK